MEDGCGTRWGGGGGCEDRLDGGDRRLEEGEATGERSAGKMWLLCCETECLAFLKCCDPDGRLFRAV